ncbi:two component system sensor histidine kinase [Desulfosarcina variabilis str. Montpellier]|uniref:cache domain-containing protein n=1 Tax=Desulfosarcina variabilis TaxID=2300 RepID=UPI003AFB63E2
MFKQLRIRHKLVISYSIVLILSIFLGSSFIYFFVRDKLTAGLESELNNTTTTILNMVKTAAAVSIKNHLRAVAEKNLEIIRYFYNQSQNGAMTASAAQAMATQILLSQTIGDSGYIYCIDSQGKVTVHPQTPLINTNVADFAFVREQLSRKSGYIEYDWKNPGESQFRPKALYMVYFEPWDWIVSASTYRNEFNSLVNVGDFEKSVLQPRFGKTGYSFVIDGNGKILIHPILKGVNLFKAKDLPDQYLKEMQQRKSGKIIYPWKNPGEYTARSKLVIFNHIPEYDWIVASSSYLDEFYAPMRTVRNLIIATTLVTFLLVLPISFKIGASITNPLQKLTHHFDRMIAGDFSSRMVISSNDEVGQLAAYYNRFADKIEHYRDNLEKQMDQRREIEEALRASEARYRLVMEAAPDPIVVYDMNGLVTYFNPAFTRTFGYELADCLGKKMDHFVPPENWEETHRMISAVIANETLSSIPTRRYTKSGTTVEVTVSGATYRNRNGELDGSVIILRDVTQSRKLEKQMMEIGDQVRRRIGQDLHDDLCPHLIGIQGLSTVLTENLREVASPSLALAEKVVELNQSAIEKSRRLARGLCPVHLVAHGLFVALVDIARHTEAVFDLVCRVKGDEQVVVADNTVATHLYYIAQEAVQNAVKHSDASRIEISLTEDESRIYLSISDNGHGLPRHLESSGIGLQIMQYRANIIGAVFKIVSPPDAGTTIHVSLGVPGKE